jgi:hypothetical protein
MTLEENDVSNDCAGEDQQQFNRLIGLKFFKLPGYLIPCIK